MLRDSRYRGRVTRELEPGGMRQDECVHSGETSCMSVCHSCETSCLSMRVGGILAGTFVYRHGPRTVGPEHGSRTVGPAKPVGPPLALFCRCVPVQC